MPIASSTEVIGKGLAEGFLSESEIRSIVARGLAQLDLDGRRVLAVIPDGTRTMPMPMLFGTLEQEVMARAKRLDFLIATGTHTPMSDSQLSRHVGRKVVDGLVGGIRIFNHAGDDAATLEDLGVIPSTEIAAITGRAPNNVSKNIAQARKERRLPKSLKMR